MQQNSFALSKFRLLFHMNARMLRECEDHTDSKVNYQATNKYVLNEQHQELKGVIGGV